MCLSVVWYVYQWIFVNIYSNKICLCLWCVINARSLLFSKKLPEKRSEEYFYTSVKMDCIFVWLYYVCRWYRILNADKQILSNWFNSVALPILINSLDIASKTHQIKLQSYINRKWGKGGDRIVCFAKLYWRLLLCTLNTCWYQLLMYSH